MKKKIAHILTLLLCCMGFVGHAVTYYNKSSGTAALQTLSNWGTNTDGSGTAPSNFTTSGNIFNLYNGSTATISGSWVITGGTLNVGNGAAMNLTIPTTFSLTGTGVVNVSAGATLTLRHTANPTLGSLNATSTVVYGGTGAQSIVAATYGNLTIAGTRSGTPAITFPAATVTVTNTFSVSPSGAVTYVTTGNTFAYAATTGSQSVESVIPYNNLTMSNTSGTNTADGNLTVAGVLTTTAGGTLNMVSYSLSVTGSPVNNGTIRTQNTGSNPVSSGKTWAGTVNYDAASGGQTIMPGTYATLTLGNTSGTSTADGAITVNTALNTTAGGIFDMSTFVLAGTLTTITNNGILETDNTSTTPFTTGKVWGGSGIVKYNLATGGQTIMAGTYNCDLTLANTSGTNSASGVLTINGDLTITGGTLSMGSNAIAGSVTAVNNNGTITTSSTTNPALPAGKTWTNSGGTAGTVSFIRSTGGQSIPGGTYYNLTCANTSSTTTAVGALTVNGTLTTTSGGAMAMAANQLTGSFTPVNNGTITTTSTANPPIPAGKNWTGTTGIVTFSRSTGGQVIPPGIYKTLRCSNTSGTNTAIGNLVVNTSITTSSTGGTLDMDVYTLSGSLTSFTNSGTIRTQNTSSAPLPSGRSIAGTVNYYAPSGGQTIVPEAYYTILTLSNTSGTNTAGGNLPVKTALNIAAGGTLEMTAAYVISNTLTTITNNGTIRTSVPTSVSSAPLTSAKTWGGTGTVVYAATAGSQTIMRGTYNNLTLLNSSGTSTASGVITVNGTLTTTSGGTFSMSSYALSGATTPVNNGTITTASTTNPAIPAGKNWSGTTGNVIFSRLTGGQFIPAGTYQTLKVSNTSGTHTAVGVLNVTTSLITTSGGTLAMGTNQLTGACTPTHNGTLTTSSTANPAIPAGQSWIGTTGVVNFTLSSGGQFVPDGFFKTLIFSNSSGTNTAVGDIDVSGTMTVTSGGSLNMGTANILSGTGTFANNGTIQTSVPSSTSTVPLPPGKTWTGLINYAAAGGSQTVVDGTYTNLTLSNTSGTNDAGGDIVVNTGTMTTTAGGTLDMGTTAILSGTGTFTNNGTIVTAVPTSVSATPIPSGKTWAGIIGYIAPAGSQTVVSQVAYNNLALTNTSGVNTSAANLVVNGALYTVSGSGILDMGSFTLSGSLTAIIGGGTIQTANTSATPISSGKTWTQTIDYNQPTGGQTIVSGTYNGGLTNSNTTSGTNTVVSGGTISISGDLTLAAGSTLNDNGVNISLAGNIAGSGTHTGSGSIIMTQSGGSISSATLGDLTLNNAGGFTLSGDPVINGTLTLSSGRLDVGSNTLTFSTSASAVAGTLSSSRMIIANGGGMVVKQFTGTGSYLFPVGDNSPAYSPVTLNFTGGTFGSGAYAGVQVVNAKHPQNANTTNYLNRYWTVTTSAITSPLYSVAATYPTSDVVGTEANISMGKFLTAWTKYGATNTSTHTLTATAVTNTNADFTGIASANPTVSVAPPATALCSGASVTLVATGTGSPSLTYTWAPSTGLSATTGASVIAAPTGTVTATYVYTVTMTDGNGFVASATATVTLNPAPASITGTSSSCTGSSTTLANATSGGNWSSSNTAVATIGSATGIVNGISAGSAIITYSLSTGCRDTSIITINTPPSAITGTATLCQNTTTTLSNGSGGTWTSGNTSIATVGSSTGIVAGVSSGTATITFTGGAGCFVTRIVTVNPIQPITGVASACVGSSTTLASATGGGVWSSSNTAIGTVGSSSGIVSGISVGSFIVSYTLGTGCRDTDVVAINALPSAITGTTNVCVGSTTTLSSAGGGTWTSSNTSVASVGSGTGVVTGVAAGTATITFTAGSSCFTTATVTVNPLPASITGTTIVCVGSGTTLASSTGGGNWTSSNTSFATVGSASGLVTGVAAGTPIITYALSTGCRVTAAVTVNPIPAAIAGAASVCVGLTTTLTNSTGGGVWSSGNTAQAAIGSASGIITGVAAGTPGITYTLSTGCFASATATVNALPAAITGTATVCTGSATTLSSSTGGGIWTSSNTGIATVGTGTGVVTGVAAGSATITYTLTSGCIATRVATVYASPAAISGTANVCVGLTRTLSNATGGGTWSSSNTSLATVGATGITTGVSAGSVTITYALATGCRSVLPFTVNALPASIAGPSAVCDGASITLTNTTGGGSWSSSDVATAVIGSATGIITAVSSGSANISYTLPTGCRAVKSVTVNDLPDAITGAVDTCVGISITLSNTVPGGTWSSSTPSVATIGSASGIATGISAGITTITYTLTATGCYEVVGLPVNPMPGSITGVLAVCDGSETPLGNSIGGGDWISSNTARATVDTGTGDVLGITAGTVTISYILPTGCFTTAVVTVSATPSLSAATDNSPICQGGTLTLTASSPANVTGYSWSGPVAITSSTSSSASVPAATTMAAGTYTVTVTNGSGIGCSADYTTTVTINPTPTAAPVNNGPICNGGTVSLTANPAGGTATYVWAGAGLSSTTAQNPTATPTVTTTYSLTVTNGSGDPGCSPATVYTTMVTVNPKPAAAPTNNGPICRGGTVTLTANPSGGASVYTWSGASLSATTAQNPTATPTVTTTYSLTVTNGSGLSGCSPATVYVTTVTVNLAPTLTSATNGGPICAGATLGLTANGPVNVATYSWSGPVAITNSATASASVPSASTAAAGTYTVTVRNGSGPGCSASYTTAATVNALPTAAPSSNAPICTGGTVTLAANPAGSTTGYTWSGAALSSTTAQNPTATPTVTTTYSLTVSYSSGLPGCSPTTIYTTIVSVNPVPTAAPSNNGPSCSGGTVTLSANPANGANTYAWSGASLSSTTAQNPTATPTVTTTYSLTVSYGTGRPGCSPSTVYTTTVTVYPAGRWLGAVDTMWSNNSNWCGNVPLITTDVLIPTGVSRYPVIVSGTYPSRNITIQSGATLRIAGGVLQIAGSISNSGTFTATTGEVEMTGSSAQAIPAAVFAGNTIKNLTVNNSGGVTLGGPLNVTGILKATTGTFNTGGYITLVSNATQTALIDGSGAGTVSGNVTMQRYLDSSFGYRYISSPHQAATLGQLSGNINLSAAFPAFYSYNENVNYAGYVIDTAVSDTLKPMHGYVANFGTSHSSSTFSLTGIVNNGSMSYTLYNNNQPFTLGYNLVGNPYPSPINWTASSGWTKTNIDNAVYYFNHGDTNQYYGRYSSYVGGISSDGIASNIIPAMQGFFVHVSNGSFPVTGTLGFTNAVRTTALNPHYFKQTAPGDKPLLRIDAGFSGNAANSDPAVIYFDDMATGKFDRDLDALKLINTDESIPSLYALSSDDNRLSIQALPAFSDSITIVPLGLQASAGGAVTFNTRTVENIPSGMHIWFYDVKTGHIQDLVTEPKYQENIGSGKTDNRFFLMFTTKGKENIPAINGGLNAYSSGGSLFVYLMLGKGTLVVTNAAGQEVGRQVLTGTGYQEVKLQVSSGIYIATLYSDMGKQSKKIFIGNQ